MKTKTGGDTLSPELARKASQELNERKREAQAKRTTLTKLMQNDEKLKHLGVLDDATLTCFLRVAKYDEKAALKRIKNYQAFKQKNPDLFTDLLPSAVKKDWEKAGFAILASRTKQGELVLLLDLAYFHQALKDGSTFDELFKPYIYASNQFIGSNKTQINGVILIVNMENVNAMALSVKLGGNLKKAMNYFANSFPLRVKGIHAINNSVAVSVLVGIIGPFISSKMSGRIQTHGKNLDSLLEKSGLQLKQLPVSFGGNLADDRGWWLEHQLYSENERRLVPGVLDDIV